jgi:hypothetical protein
MLDVEYRPAVKAHRCGPRPPGIAAGPRPRVRSRCDFLDRSTKRIAGLRAARVTSGLRRKLPGVTDVDSQRPRRRQASRRRGRCESTSVTPLAWNSSFSLHRRTDRHSSTSNDRSCKTVHQRTAHRPAFAAAKWVDAPFFLRGSSGHVLRTSNDRGSAARTRTSSVRRPATAPAALSAASAC